MDNKTTLFYTTARRFGLRRKIPHPSTPPPLPPPFEDIDLALELNPGTSNIQDLLRGEDVQRVVRKTVAGIQDMRRKERAADKDELVKVDSGAIKR